MLTARQILQGQGYLSPNPSPFLSLLAHLEYLFFYNLISFLGSYMHHLSWSCLDLNNAHSQRAVSRRLHVHRVDVCFLCDSRIALSARWRCSGLLFPS